MIYIFICSNQKSSPNPLAVQQARQVLLQLLAHPMNSLRMEAYQALLEIVKVSFMVYNMIQRQSSEFHNAGSRCLKKLSIL